MYELDPTNSSIARVRLERFGKSNESLDNLLS